MSGDDHNQAEGRCRVGIRSQSGFPKLWPECSCGWVGCYWSDVDDAQREADRHRGEVAS